MRISKIIVAATAIVWLTVQGVSPVLATPSKDFFEEDGKVVDEFGVFRTQANGPRGFYQLTEKTFRPIIAFESLGEYRDVAYGLGEWFSERYPDRYQRAEKIFEHVRDHVRYTADSDQFGFDEFALNADEVALTIQEKGYARGDCEDSAVLLAVVFKSAGYRSAIAILPEHTAALVYLPGYRKANVVFTLNGEKGWVWAEATARTNPLGWAPKQVHTAPLAAYEISDEAVDVQAPQARPTEIPQKEENTPLQISPFVLTMMLMWILPSFISFFRRRR